MHTARYGASIRKLYDKAIKSKRQRYECPKCHKIKVKRISNSKWECYSCGTVLAGGAYALNTEAGEIATRLVAEYAKSG
ncbi:50S ribosomal protein L37ae [Candidatus Micrarchaeota archaeon]|nr:50S ribosomal protein L37ae [Candidatus Micrarchaeota archaeon]